MGLTKKQQRAVDYYLVYGDKAQALKTAGYSKGTSVERVFENKNVVQYLNQNSSNTEIATTQEIMTYLTRIMKGLEVEKDSVVIKTGKDTTDIKVIEKPLTVTLRLKAAEMLIKWLTGNNDTEVVPVVINDDLKKI